MWCGSWLHDSMGIHVRGVVIIFKRCGVKFYGNVVYVLCIGDRVVFIEVGGG